MFFSTSNLPEISDSSTERPISVLRVDGGDVIGYGHLMRSIGLATVLREHGFRTVFYSRLIDGSGIETLRRAGETYVTIPPHISEEEEPSWVKRHAGENHGKVSIYIIDGYHLPENHWEQYQEDAIVYTTDVFGGRDYSHVDLIYNGYTHAPDMDYSRCLSHTKLLLGLQWTVVRQDVYPYLPKQNRTHPEFPRKILVNGGGVDEHNVTGRVADALVNLPEHMAPVEAYFITGLKYPFGPELDQKLERLPYATRLTQPENWLEILSSSDLAVIAGGSVIFETAMLGTPGLIFVVEENQKGSALATEKLGVHKVAGWLKDLTDEQILTAYMEIASNREMRESISNRGRELLDGKGAYRVVEEIQKSIETLR